MSIATAPQRDSTLRPWLITFLLAGLIGAGVHYWHAPRAAAFPAPAGENRADWYLVLRMPALTSQYESGVSIMETRYAEWLQALTRAGFYPTLLSDVYRARRSGNRLPRKSVVLVFDPGHRRTAELMSPILKAARWPAVWLSDEQAMKNRRREYITFHTARAMTDSGLWDVGVKKADGTYSFSIGQNDSFVLGRNGNDAWMADGGGFGLNRNLPLEHLNWLHVNSKWSANDLLNRINAEVPIEGPSYLTIGQVQNQDWGIIVPARVALALFTMAAPSQRKGTSVSWMGTEGIDNLKAKVKSASLTGTFSLRFRWDEASDTGVQISVSRNDVIVEERLKSEKRLVTSFSRKPQSSFDLQLLLVGTQLSLAIDGQNIPVPQLQSENRRVGLTQLYVSDRVRDAARAADVQFYFEPLSNDAVMWTPPTPTPAQ